MSEPAEQVAQSEAAISRSTSHPALTTRFCELVGVRLPVVQTGMGWVSGATLTAATANAGGLGILASATMTFDELDDGEASGESEPAKIRSTLWG